MFHLTVGLWVSHCCPVHTYVVSVAEFQELSPGELCAIIGDYGVWYSKSVDDIREEQHSLFGLDPCGGSDFNPLGKLVDCDKQVGEAPERLLQRSDKIEAPDGKGPGDGDSLQSLGGEMNLSSVKLASLTGPHDLRGVGYGGGPIEALSEGISYQRPRCGVVATSPRVYVLQELDFLLTWDAAHKDARGAALIHFPVKEDKSLGPTSHTPCLSLV